MSVYAIYFAALHSVAISEPTEGNDLDEAPSIETASFGFLRPHQGVTELGLGFNSHDHERFMPELRIARTFTEQLSVQLDVSHQRYLRQDWLEYFGVDIPLEFNRFKAEAIYYPRKSRNFNSYKSQFSPFLAAQFKGFVVSNLHEVDVLLGSSNRGGNIDGNSAQFYSVPKIGLSWYKPLHLSKSQFVSLDTSLSAFVPTFYKQYLPPEQAEPGQSGFDAMSLSLPVLETVLTYGIGKFSLRAEYGLEWAHPSAAFRRYVDENPDDGLSLSPKMFEQLSLSLAYRFGPVQDNWDAIGYKQDTKSPHNEPKEMSSIASQAIEKPAKHNEVSFGTPALCPIADPDNGPQLVSDFNKREFENSSDELKQGLRLVYGCTGASTNTYLNELHQSRVWNGDSITYAGVFGPVVGAVLAVVPVLASSMDSDDETVAFAGLAALLGGGAVGAGTSLGFLYLADEKKRTEIAGVLEVCSANDWSCSRDERYNRRRDGERHLELFLNHYIGIREYLESPVLLSGGESNPNKRSSSRERKTPTTVNITGLPELASVIQKNPRDRAAYAEILQAEAQSTRALSSKLYAVEKHYQGLIRMEPTNALVTALELNRLPEVEEASGAVQERASLLRSEISNNQKWMRFDNQYDSMLETCKQGYSGLKYKSDYSSRHSSVESEYSEYLEEAKAIGAKAPRKISRACTSYLRNLKSKGKRARKSPAAKRLANAGKEWDGLTLCCGRSRYNCRNVRFTFRNGRLRNSNNRTCSIEAVNQVLCGGNSLYTYTNGSYRNDYPYDGGVCCVGGFKIDSTSYKQCW